jgi:CO/xanthine dehydrogenase Mo-binding subunit
MRAAFLTTTVIGFFLGAVGSSASARSGSSTFSPIEASDAEAAARSAWRLKVEAAKQRYEAFAARAESEFRARRPTPLADPAGLEPFSAVLDDPTLRYNDLIVTADGVFIFRGAEGPRHGAADFERLPDSRVRALSLRTFDKTN